MIEYLRLDGIGVINDADVELSDGLTVLTGETGAGKTLVLTALDLLLGGKADTGLVSGEVASVEGAWRVSEHHLAVERVEEAGGVIDDGLLVIGRSVPASGRSRCFAGGRTVPQTLLSEIGPDLVAVHGQSDQSLLKSESSQRGLLDKFGGEALGTLLHRYRDKYREVLQLDDAVAIAVAGQAQRSQELADIKVALERIEQVSPKSGEDQELATRAQRLAKADELVTATQSALNAISTDDDDSSDITRLLSAA
ncbi:MAG: AAA family ATPase, partial [Rhodanobacter sp.]